MERHMGTVKPLDITDPEGFAEKYCLENKLKKQDYHESFWEVIREEVVGCEFINIKDKVFCLKDLKEVDEDHSYMIKNDDGSVFLDVSFYNGGGSLDEVLESMFKHTEV